MGKASTLFFALPYQVRDKIKVFLTSQEWKELLDFKKNPLLRTKDIDRKQLKIFLKEMSFLSEAGKKLIGGKLYLLSFLFFSFLALAQTEYSISIYLFLYAGIGYICIKKKSPTYWRIHFFGSRLEPNFLLFSCYAYALLLLSLGYDRADDYAKLYWNYSPSLFFMAQACFFGPLFEEIFFRGYIFETAAAGLDTRAHGKKYNENLGIWISSFLFAIIHLHGLDIENLLKDMGLFFCAGLVLGLLRWYTRSLLYCSGVHIAFNTTILFI